MVAFTLTFVTRRKPSAATERRRPCGLLRVYPCLRDAGPPACIQPHPMNATLPRPIPSRWLVLFGLFVTCNFPILWAQPSAGTGSIAGRVFEGATGKSLQGAVVHVVGTTISDTTDPDGRFQLSG